MSQSYHRIIRKVVIAFGNLFNNINISRYDSAGIEKEKFLVPIVYGGKEKYVSRLEGDPSLDKKVQVTLPIMSFEMTDMSYDASRKLNTNHRNTYPSHSADKSLAIWNPVPFDFKFTLWAYVRNIEDGAQLVEKILPFFTPDYTVSVNLVPEMGIIKQLPIILDSVSHEVDYEGDYNSKVRNIIWTLNFTVKGYLYGAISEPKVIRTSITNILDGTDLEQKNVILNLSNGQFDYKVNEKVYQGYSYETATSTAKVVDWVNTSNTLTISDLNGHFVVGSQIKGMETNATWNVASYKFESANLVNVTITPDPSNVVLPNNYTYSTTITEYPDT